MFDQTVGVLGGQGFLEVGATNLEDGIDEVLLSQGAARARWPLKNILAMGSRKLERFRVTLCHPTALGFGGKELLLLLILQGVRPSHNIYVHNLGETSRLG